MCFLRGLGNHLSTLQSPSTHSSLFGASVSLAFINPLQQTAVFSFNTVTLDSCYQTTDTVSNQLVKKSNKQDWNSLRERSKTDL